MRYPVVIEIGTPDTAFGVVVPDLPGCFAAGETLDQAMLDAEQAIALWIDAVLDAGEAIPLPSPLEAIRKRKEFKGWTFGLVSVDPAALDDRIERVNITLPRRVLRRLDQRAKASGESRSGFIARLAMG